MLGEAGGLVGVQVNHLFRFRVALTDPNLKI
jgi:hypothetical protein